MDFKGGGGDLLPNGRIVQIRCRNYTYDRYNFLGRTVESYKSHDVRVTFSPSRKASNFLVTDDRSYDG